MILAPLGRGTSPQAEIQERFAELTGVSFEPTGLTWDGYAELDAAVIALGACPRALPPFTEVGRDGLDAFLDDIAATPVLVDLEDRGRRAASRTAVEIRRWAAERYRTARTGPADEHEVAWRAYDLPG